MKRSDEKPEKRYWIVHSRRGLALSLMSLQRPGCSCSVASCLRSQLVNQCLCLLALASSCPRTSPRGHPQKSPSQPLRCRTASSLGPTPVLPSFSVVYSFTNRIVSFKVTPFETVEHFWFPSFPLEISLVSHLLTLPLDASSTHPLLPKLLPGTRLLWWCLVGGVFP